MPVLGDTCNYGCSDDEFTHLTFYRTLSNSHKVLVSIFSEFYK